MQFSNLWPGFKVVQSPHALKDSKVRAFPASRHRSPRIHKKLIKRFGGEFQKVPCIWKVDDTLFVHPVLYPDVMKELRK